MIADAIRIGPGEAGLRLDRALCAHAPELGLRAARRMIKDGAVLLNGGIAGCSKKVSLGDMVEIVGSPGETAPLKTPKLLGTKGGYRFFYKPSGLHTAEVAGRFNFSLERMLREIVPDGFPGILLQRLDHGSAGLVCAALDEAVAREYRRQEKLGLCVKNYYAILQGRMQERKIARMELDANGGRKVRALSRVAPELEWTYFKPLWQGCLPGWSGALTLASCRLHSGKRHQVRAHAAALGYPLAGDPVYGGAAEEAFVLEHYELRMPRLHVRYIDADSLIAKEFAHKLAVIAGNEVGLCM